MSSSNCATLYEAKKLSGGAGLVIWEIFFTLKTVLRAVAERTKKPCEV